jgi:hypothetical protein
MKIYKLTFVIGIIFFYNIYNILQLVDSPLINLGWSDWVMLDAKALARGFYTYNNPSFGYSGGIYSPLYVMLLAILLKIYWWNGWSVFIAFFSAVIFIWKLTKWRNDKNIIIKFLIFFTIFFVSLNFIPEKILFEARPDSLALSLLFVLLLKVHEYITTLNKVKAKDIIEICLYSTLTIATKQNYILPILIILSYYAYSFFKKKLIVTICLTSILILLFLFFILRIEEYILFDHLFGISNRHYYYLDIFKFIERSVEEINLTLLMFILVIGILFYINQNLRKNRMLVFHTIFLVSLISITFIGMAKQGGGTNHLAFYSFYLIFLLKILDLKCRFVDRFLNKLEINKTKYVIFGFLVFLSSINYINSQNKKVFTDLKNTPIDYLRFLNSEKTIFDINAVGYPSYSTTRLSASYPVFNIDLLAAGYVPRYVIDNLINGKYDFAVKIKLNEQLDYSTSYGKRNSNTLWLINEVISNNYESSDSDYFFVKKSNQLPLLGKCFSPWISNKLVINITAGQGILCPFENHLVVSHIESEFIKLELKDTRFIDTNRIYIKINDKMWRLSDRELERHFNIKVDSDFHQFSSKSLYVVSLNIKKFETYNVQLIFDYPILNLNPTPKLIKKYSL